MWRCFSAWSLLMMTGCLPVTIGPPETEQQAHAYGSHQFVAMADNDYTPESSGVIASHLNRDVFWTHNDSGHRPRVWAFRLNDTDIAAGTLKHLGYITLIGVPAGDWEDIARGPGNQLYIFDGGDNARIRTDKCVLRFGEPRIESDDVPFASQRTPDVIRFEYPDPDNPTRPANDNRHRYNAESLFVHPTSGDLFFITKQGPNGPSARVYRFAAHTLSWNAEEIHVPEFIADLSTAVGTATAADISPDGRYVLIRNYFTAYEFTRPADGPFERIFSESPTYMAFLRECQGEGICYTADGQNLITTSEARLEFFCPSRMPVYLIPALSAQLAE